MQLSFKIWLVGVIVTMSLFSCSDERDSPSPLKLRIKTVENGSAKTVYSYDNRNRLSTISSSDGSLAVLSYGDSAKKYVTTDVATHNTYYVEYPNGADQTTGFITRYPYDLDGTSFLAIKYRLINSKISYDVRIRDYQYNFDANKHLSSLSNYYEHGGVDVDGFNFNYTGDNITKNLIYYNGGHVYSTYTYVYDDKVNPFYGLLYPYIDPILGFSRNNALSKTNTGDLVSTTYEYEYNQQNLPVKRTAKQKDAVVGVLTFGYESY